ncbi:ATP-binding protein [Ruegeria sp.]|uniref:ATP-binding protein n=1 Tax=Ruegeria sp. TaxID=1879320 RepID=UPI0023235A30|nr:ATP-binding protein [Ruegeria sp.]MDA7966457.1 ATP-binding protein [Ruegeria sp.]
MACNGDMECLDLSFQAIDARASTGIALLGTRLTELGVPTHRAGDIKIALAEAINNVVEHAYADIPPAAIRVKCCLCRDQLEVQILDTGNPMPGLQVPDGVPASVETTRQNLPEGGFGWFLIRQLTSEIRYERQEGRNLLFLRFDLTDMS